MLTADCEAIEDHDEAQRARTYPQHGSSSRQRLGCIRHRMYCRHPHRPTAIQIARCDYHHHSKPVEFHQPRLSQAMSPRQRQRLKSGSLDGIKQAVSDHKRAPLTKCQPLPILVTNDSPDTGSKRKMPQRLIGEQGSTVKHQERSPLVHRGC